MRTINRTALSNCNIPLLPNQRYVSIKLLTGETVFFVTELKGRCQTVFNQVSNYLGLNDAELFSLAIKYDGEYVFIEQGVKLHKYASKAWKNREMGLDVCGKPLLTFYFRVNLYVDCHLLISDKTVRHHYYLQLKENVPNYCQALSDDRAFVLAAYALQADLGNFQSDKHIGNYFEPSKYFNKLIISNLGEEFLCRHTPVLHKDNAGLSKGEAQVCFIKEASNETAQHNLHVYKMRRKKGKTEDVWVGISAKSLQIFEDNGDNPKTRLANFSWSDISKIHFEKKKFEICCAGNPKARKFTYYLKNEVLAKSLFWLCRLTHQFNMAVQPRVAELKKYELEATVPFRESYIYSDRSELRWLGSDKSKHTINDLSKKGLLEEQRKSVISNASSNTTSGIVSDRDKIHSLYESEDELDIIGVETVSRRVFFSENEIYANGKSRSASGDGTIFDYQKPKNKKMGDSSSKYISSSFPTCSKTHLVPKTKQTVPVNYSLNSLHSLESLQTQNHLPNEDEKRNFKVPVYEPKYFIFEENNKDSGTPLSAKAVSVCALPNPCLSENFVNSAINCNVQYTTNRNALANSYSNVDSVGFHSGVQTLNRNQSRNVTRIGVSSLTKGRIPRAPLTLYRNRQAGSEPELNHLRTWSSNFSIDSEHSLPPNMISGKYDNQNYRHSLANGFLPQPHIGPSITWQSDTSIPSSNYSTLNSNKSIPISSSYSNTIHSNFIPPPASYLSLNHSGNEKKIVKNSENESDGAVGLSQSQVDIHQLWEKSKDMELPLLTALCNDRSLMMLPKTVATCSRQRHMNASTDLRRFSCSYLATPLEYNPFGVMNKLGFQTLGSSRPSWPKNPTWHNLKSDIDNANKLGIPPSPTVNLTTFGKIPTQSHRPHSLSAPLEMGYCNSTTLSKT